MKKILLITIRFFGAILPQTVPELIYTSLPAFLKRPVNALLYSFIPEYIKIGTVEIALNKKDPVVCGALTLGVYEKCESRLIQEKLKPGMIVVDLGANVGLYTALAASIVGSSGKVYAFEPDAENFGYLEKTVARNGFTNVTCLRSAVSDHNGTGNLFHSDENLGDHRIYDSRDGRASNTIALTTLDYFAETKKISKIDFIKMDIQGAEGWAMKGMEQVIAKSPHMQIFAEFWPLGISRTGESPTAFLATLKRHGFSIFEINRTSCSLLPVTHIESFSNKFQGREFANLYCIK